VKRTTITLPDDLAAALERETRRRHTSASAVVREALTRYLGLSVDGEPRKLPFASLGRSGHHDTAENAEEILAGEWVDDLRDR
jgi:Arc/MetJ-type ribon-helix-helix transcriptional regulator